MLTHLIKTGKKLDENIFRIIYAEFVVQVKPQLAESAWRRAYVYGVRLSLLSLLKVKAQGSRVKGERCMRGHLNF